MARQVLGKKTPAKDCLLHLIAEVPEFFNSMNYAVLCEEHYWMKANSVIFPETADILYRLREAKLSLTQSQGLTMPHDSFLLAFPKDYKISSVPAMGCMVTFIKLEDRREHQHYPFLDYLGIKKNVTVTDLQVKGLYLTYFCPFNNQIVIRASIPEDLFVECLRASSAVRFGELLGSYQSSDALTLNARDLEYQFELFQIIVRIGIYAASCDSALREGYPHVRPKHLEPKGLLYRDQTLGLSRETRVSAHYRSWHFRQLTNKRFYQGAHAKKPIGSRIVFVKDTMVQLKVEAETLA